MTSLYVIDYLEINDEESINKKVNEIKKINPDKIICNCLEEYEALYIFKNFIDKIMPWLELNNKYINLIVPDTANNFANRIIPEKSLSTLISVLPSFNEWQQAIHQSEPHYFYEIKHLLNSSKLFTCYINKCNHARALMIDKLAEYKMIPKGIVTLIQPEMCHSVYNQKFDWKFHTGEKLVDESDFELNDKSRPEFSAAGLPKSFLNGFMDIVCESRYSENEFMITEKTLKSIATLKPFIVLSCTGYHTKFLRDNLGLELYDEIFDYSFDTEINLGTRITGIIENVNRLETLLNNKGKEPIITQICKKLYKNRSTLIDLYFDKHKVIPKSLKPLMFDDWVVYDTNKSAVMRHMRDMRWITKHNAETRLQG